MPLRPPHQRRHSRGFTLIELLTVVAILGILAAIAVTAYVKNVRNAHRTEVLADLANITLRQRTAFNVRGTYVTTTFAETDTYPRDPVNLAIETTAMKWDITEPEYSRDGVGSTAYMRGGGSAHGWDALNFMPENAQSWCAYGIISGDGTQGAFGDVPPAFPLSAQVFPTTVAGAERYYARDWFYAFAKCDFDRDGQLWEFTVTHYSSQIVESNQGE